MTLLLKLSKLIDWLTERVGKGAFWLVLLMTIISSANAVVRFIFNYSSNGLLEIQWYLFAAVFLLCSPYTHITPALPIGALEGPFLGRSRQIYTGRIKVGRDGDFVSMPADSGAITVTDRLKMFR